MILTLMSKIGLSSLRTIAVMVTVVFFNFVILSSEILPIDEIEDTDRDFGLVLEELNISVESMREVFSDVYLTVAQKEALDVAVAKVSKVNNVELREMDPRFRDGITAIELLDFLLEFGKNHRHLMTRDKKKEHREDIEELTVYGYSFGHISEDPAEFSVDDIRYMRNIRERANRLYRERRYDVAYPLLLDLAKRGFRDAQSRLAYILFSGSSNVQKSNIRALGWLGAASAPPTEPGFRVLFKKYMRQVPHEVLPRVEAVVISYREQYSHSGMRTFRGTVYLQNLTWEQAND